MQHGQWQWMRMHIVATWVACGRSLEQQRVVYIDIRGAGGLFQCIIVSRCVRMHSVRGSGGLLHTGMYHYYFVSTHAYCCNRGSV